MVELIELFMNLALEDDNLDLKLESLRQLLEFYMHNYGSCSHELIEIAVKYLPMHPKICEFYCNNKLIGFEVIKRVVSMFEFKFDVVYFKILVEYVLLNGEILYSQSKREIVHTFISLLYKLSMGDENKNIQFQFKESKLFEYFLAHYRTFGNCLHFLLMLITNLIDQNIYNELTVTENGLTRNQVISYFEDFVCLFIKTISSSFYQSESFTNMRYPAIATIERSVEFSSALTNFNKLVSISDLHHQRFCNSCNEDMEMLNMFFESVKNGFKLNEKTQAIFVKLTRRLSSNKYIKKRINNDLTLKQILKEDHQRYKTFYYS